MCLTVPGLSGCVGWVRVNGLGRAVVASQGPRPVQRVPAATIGQTRRVPERLTSMGWA